MSYVVVMEDWDRQGNDVLSAHGPFSTKQAAVNYAGVIVAASMRHSGFTAPPLATVFPLYPPVDIGDKTANPLGK